MRRSGKKISSISQRRVGKKKTVWPGQKLLNCPQNQLKAHKEEENAGKKRLRDVSKEVERGQIFKVESCTSFSTFLHRPRLTKYEQKKISRSNNEQGYSA